MIFGLIKKSYETVMENPSITLYFVLYLIVLNFLAAWVITSNNINASITLIVASMLLSMAFSSGWFQVFCESVDKDKIKEKNYFSIFLEGMGKNIIPVAIASIIFAFLIIGVIILSSVILNLLYKDFDSVLREIIIIVSGAPAGDFMKSLSENQKYMLYIWQMVINLLSAICIFIFMYYFPSIIKSNCENMFLKPFYELWKSVCFLFENFFLSLLLFFIIYMVHIIIDVLKIYLIHNSILSILLLFMWIYFISISIMLIFNYYEQKNICNNGPDCIEQNANGDSSSEEN